MTLCFLQNFLLLIILTLSCFSLQSSRFRTRLSARKKLELTLNTAKHEQTKDKARPDQIRSAYESAVAAADAGYRTAVAKAGSDCRKT
jgi:hypothetical protein